MPPPVAYDLDFRTREAVGAYNPEREEACVNLVIVDSAGVELTESLVADITLTQPSPVIEISEAMSFTIIQILDDDSMCSLNSVSIQGYYLITLKMQSWDWGGQLTLSTLGLTVHKCVST